MADDGSAQSTAVWPLPKFHFEVKWDSAVMHFQQISGLDAESQPIEYRRGDSPQFSVVEMPGIKKYSEVTMKKGVFKSEHKFWDWFNQIKMNTIKRKPIKISGTDLKSASNEVAVETLVISHERLTIASA